MSLNDHDDFGGLHRDLLATGRKVGRRRLLTLAGGIGASFGALQLMGCGGDSNPNSPSTTTGTDGTGTTGTGTTGGGALCAARVPEETAGPFPGDGSNGPNVLPLTGAVRSDIRSSFAGMSGTADGVPLTIALTIVSASTCAPLAGRAVYIWHCDRLGRYSLYNSGVTNQNYLRGVQEADAQRAGRVHVDLPRVLRRPLAAHPLRGVSDAGRGADRGQQGRHVADRAAEGELRRGLRHHRLRAERHATCRRSRSPRTTFSATEPRSSWRR